MRTSWHDIWGSARGPIQKLAPQARILCGASVFAACMIAPATRPEGVVAVSALLLAWAGVVRPPARIVRSTLCLGLALFLPYLLLVPLIQSVSPDRGWLDALAAPWTVLFRGMTAMHASVYTSTALSASELRQGLSRLPIPRILAAVLIQIVHQTAGLIYETRQIASAIAVRGGTSGCRTGIRILAFLPSVWIPRVMDRAERVGAAMELRGYCERDLSILGVAAMSWRDVAAVASAAVISGGVCALRVWGCP